MTVPFFAQPIALSDSFTLPSRAILSPLEGIMNREAFFRAAASMELIDSWMPPFIAVPKGAAPSTGALRRRFGLFLESNIPLSIQLLGNDPDTLAETGAALFRIGVRSVNLNCACPSRTVLSGGSGGALLKNPGRIRDILSAIKEKTPDLCLSVKTRSGFRSPEEIPSLMEAVREGGTDWVLHHFRTVPEAYETVPFEEAIRRLRTAVNGAAPLPVFANGDIRTAEDAEIMVRETSCAGIAIGRGIMRDPFLLRKLRGAACPPDMRPAFLKALSGGEIAGKKKRRFHLECVKMAFGENSPEFREALQNSP